MSTKYTDEELEVCAINVIREYKNFPNSMKVTDEQIKDRYFIALDRIKNKILESFEQASNSNGNIRKIDVGDESMEFYNQSEYNFIDNITAILLGTPYATTF